MSQSDMKLVSLTPFRTIPPVQATRLLILICLGWTGICGCQSRRQTATLSALPVIPEVPVTPVTTPRHVPSTPNAMLAPRASGADRNRRWIPWRDWGAENGFDKVNLISASASSPAYELQSSTAVAAIRVGSRLAYWNGLECWLGFAPQLIRGQPHIHYLDALKNFGVLLEDPAPPRRAGRVIVIDPGHGGADTGAHQGGLLEKALTLDWALRLFPLLRGSGWTVFMTRSTDASVDLSERVAIADRVRADVFVSLHFNSAYPNQEQAGVETYCLSPVGMPSNLVREYEDDSARIFPNNAFDEQNLQYASRLHRTLLRSTGAVDGGIKRARFMSVLRAQKRPAVLIEGGYLSQPTEAGRIAMPGYRQALAEAVAKALE